MKEWSYPCQTTKYHYGKTTSFKHEVLLGQPMILNASMSTENLQAKAAYVDIRPGGGCDSH